MNMECLFLSKSSRLTTEIIAGTMFMHRKILFEWCKCKATSLSGIILHCPLFKAHRDVFALRDWTQLEVNIQGQFCLNIACCIQCQQVYILFNSCRKVPSAIISVEDSPFRRCQGAKNQWLLISSAVTRLERQLGLCFFLSNVGIGMGVLCHWASSQHIHQPLQCARILMVYADEPRAMPWCPAHSELVKEESTSSGEW